MASIECPIFVGPFAFFRVSGKDTCFMHCPPHRHMYGGDQTLSLPIQHWNEMNPRQVAKVIVMQPTTFINPLSIAAYVCLPFEIHKLTYSLKSLVHEMKNTYIA